MKRSGFLKSLLGLAVAPIVAREAWQGKDEMQQAYLDKEAEAKRIRDTQSLVKSVRGRPGTAVVPSTIWEIAPNEPPMSLVEYKHKMKKYHS